MCNRNSTFKGMDKVLDPSQRIVVPFCNPFHFYKPGWRWGGLLVLVMVFGDRNSWPSFMFQIVPSGGTNNQKSLILDYFLHHFELAGFKILLKTYHAPRSSTLLGDGSSDKLWENREERI